MKKNYFALILSLLYLGSFSNFAMDMQPHEVLDILCKKNDFMTKIGLLVGLENYFEKNPHEINIQNSNGETLVHVLLRLHPELKIKKSLIKAHSLGADFNITNNQGLAPAALFVQLKKDELNNRSSFRLINGNIKFLNVASRKYVEYAEDKCKNSINKWLNILKSLGAQVDQYFVN
jgi:hypothetical protein